MNPSSVLIPLVLASTVLALPLKESKELCQAGEFQDSSDGETTCRQCPSRKFSTHPNNDRSCDDCTLCQHTQILISNCTLSSDTVCGCPRGQRWELIIDEEGKCVKEIEEPTKICPAGEYQTSAPPVTCGQCPPGTFSTHPNNDRSCDDCSRCQKTQIIISDCTSTSDTLCGCPLGQRWKPFLGEQGMCVPKKDEPPKIDVSNNTKEPCMPCPFGSFQVKPCEQNGGLPTCQVCPKGFNKSTSNNAPDCKQCSICEATQTQLSPCTKSKDTICEDEGKLSTSGSDYSIYYMLSIISVVIIGIICVAVLLKYFGFKVQHPFCRHCIVRQSSRT